MKILRQSFLGALVGALLLGGCGQKDPDPQPATPQPYFPLVAGSWWEYAHGDWTERVETTSATFQGQAAFQMTDSPNPNDEDLRFSDSIVQSIDGRVVRMSKEEYSGDTATLDSSVTYGVGFTRFNEDWANQAVGYKEAPEYERVETKDGTVRPPEARKHTFEILSLSESVTTGAGTFDCIKIRRTKDWQTEQAGAEDGDEAETKLFWFARGVGKVREQNEETGNAELLVNYSIPASGG